MKRIAMLIPMLLVVAMSATGCYSTPENGNVTVVRNGGPFDNRQIRQLVCPGADLTWSGIASNDHNYPSSDVQRYYTITADKKRSDSGAADKVKVPTADGVQVGIEGQFTFTTAFDCSAKGKKALKEFDTKYGAQNRKYPWKGESYQVWDGDEGWNAFLDAMVRPVLDNEIRQAVASATCADLVPSCSLVQQGRSGDVAKALARGDSNATLAALQKAVNDNIEQQMNEALDGRYIIDVRFKVTKVALPADVQNAINQAQAAFANLSKAKAAVTEADLKEQAQAKLANLYARNPALAQIELVKNIPAGANIYFGIDPVVTVSGGGR